jgi:RHS repeat-associated protein
VRTWYVYQGEDVIATTNATGTVQHRLLHGPAVDQVLADETASTGNILWALTDHLGTVRDVVNDSGTVVNHLLYDSFGNVASETNAAVDYLFGFTGRERDEESGLNFHRARYYNPGIGRWISEDPISFAAGDYNLNRYTFNDPVNHRDPSGLSDDMGINAPSANVQFWNGAAGMQGNGRTDISDPKAFLDLSRRVVEYSDLPVDPENPDDPSDIMSQGCVGLACARLGVRHTTNEGLPTIPFPSRRARFFGTIEDARSWQLGNTPPENPTEFTIIAIQVNRRDGEEIPTPLLPNLPGQVDPRSLLARLQNTGDYNVATDLNDDLTREKWEWMNHEFPVNEGVPEFAKIDRNDPPVVRIGDDLPDSYDKTVFVVMLRRGR